VGGELFDDDDVDGSVGSEAEVIERWRCNIRISGGAGIDADGEDADEVLEGGIDVTEDGCSEDDELGEIREKGSEADELAGFGGETLVLRMGVCNVTWCGERTPEELERGREAGRAAADATPEQVRVIDVSDDGEGILELLGVRGCLPLTERWLLDINIGRRNDGVE
jgi:hypothetical protein